MTVTDLHIPEHLPPLRKGLGNSPRDGGCLMQVTNYLARGTWSDTESRNVSPTLTKVAILVNDAVCDRHRQELWRFVPRLIKTYDTYAARPESDLHTADVFYELLKQPEHNQPCGTCSQLSCSCCDRCERLIALLDKVLEIFDRFALRRVGHAERVEWSRLETALDMTDRDLDWYFRTVSQNTGLPTDVIREMSWIEHINGVTKDASLAVFSHA